MLFIRSMAGLEELHQIYDYEKAPTPTRDQCRKAMAIINKSRQYAQDYILTYGEIMPDRGAEGLIASFCETTLVYLDEVAATFEGRNAGSGEMEFYDLPPMPSEEGKK